MIERISRWLCRPRLLAAKAYQQGLKDGQTGRPPRTDKIDSPQCNHYYQGLADGSRLQRSRETALATISTILIPPAAADRPAQLACAVSLSAYEQTPENCHLRAEVGPQNGFDYPDHYYGGPAASPACIAIPPPADCLPRRVRAVAYARDRDGERILDTSPPATVCWPAAQA